MSELSRINRLSETFPADEPQGSAVVMTGSYAPIHRGHFDAMRAATLALVNRGVPVESLVITPNSAEYVANKLPEDHKTWTYERRIREILKAEPHPDMPTYVDDVSGRLAKHEWINDYVPEVIKRHLGFRAQQLYMVAGSDQLLSMESHLRNGVNKAVCVLRPGSLERVQENLAVPWVAEAVESGRFVITEREDMENDISSTDIRKSAMAE